jgi:uncharacterized protein (TIGR00297 family)
MQLKYYLFLAVVAAGILGSVLLRKLTLPAALTGGLIAAGVFAGAGFTGISQMALFFIAGTMATSWKASLKEQLGAAEKNKGRRTAGQVIANTAVAGITGCLAWLFPAQQELFRLMMAASLASAAGDTFSSELGMVYGKRFYNILSLRSDQRGLDGVVSVEGTLLGIAGTALIAMVYACGYGWNISLLWIVVAGTAGNIADSLFGAAFERRQYIGNNAVNFLNTMVAALVACLIVYVCNDR